MSPLRIGIVGLGNISGIYLKTLGGFRSTEIVAVADIDLKRAQSAADVHGIPNVLTPDELIAHPDVEMVLNLTIPAAHGPLALQAVRAGKHVYNEKPLSTDLATGRELIAAAKQAGVLVGCAPDTFLGAGIQTARHAIDSGMIGTPVGAQGFMLSRGPEPWHPNPEFFYKPGGGPMLDMGPYYITTMVNLLGPVRRTTGITRVSYPERPIALTNTGYYRDRTPETPDMIKVETPTHLVGIMEFESGPVAELTTSFDVYGEWSHHPITIFGSEGTMKVPDPNTFGGEVLVKRAGESEFKPIPVDHGFSENSRGLGVLDLAYAARNGGVNRASGDLALHVLEVMLSFTRASTEGRHQTIEAPLTRPAPLDAQDYRDEVAPVTAD